MCFREFCGFWELLLAGFGWPAQVVLPQPPLLPVIRHRPLHVLPSRLLMLSLPDECEEQAESSAAHRDVSGCRVARSLLSGVWHQPALFKDDGLVTLQDGLRVPRSQRGTEALQGRQQMSSVQEAGQSRDQEERTCVKIAVKATDKDRKKKRDVKQLR